MPRPVIKGKNDLLSRFPLVAAQADGWNPGEYAAFSDYKMPWMCEKGHKWTTRIADRTSKNNGCPCCGGWAVIEGENDLLTKFPEIAAEAHGWDPSKVKYGSDKEKKAWKCVNGHIFYSTVNNRTNGGRGCPCCAEYGYRPSKEAWIYLVEKKGEQKVGISNVPKTRLATHKRNGFRLVEIKGPMDGAKAWSIELAIKEWLKDGSLVIRGTQENWRTDAFKVSSLVEIGAKAGLDKDALRLLS
jgi:hypothetical protein